MSKNENIIKDNSKINKNKELKLSNSPKKNKYKDKNIDDSKEESLSEDYNSKINIKEDANKISTNFSTEFQTFSPHKQFINNENDNTLDTKLKNIYEDSFSNENLFLKDIMKKPKLSLKDSRTKLKELRDKLNNYLSEEEIIKKQEELLPVPLEKKNDEKFKILKMHNLKRKSLPEYKSTQKYEDYMSFEDSFNKKNEYYLLKKKKSVYSNTKIIKLKIYFHNKNKEVMFPMFLDKDIGVYEYWQVPLIESKVDEDNDSDEEQIKLATKVCELDLNEGIKYLEKNGIESLYNNKFRENNNKKNNIS